ncbi:MAG: hypothetical protein GX675_01515 [Erysipelotrichaceae bacterium]|nr:hypothetical protein [Erysipelotrichaceae bacterium]
MDKEFYFSRNNAIINYTTKYCRTVDDLLASEGFDSFLDLFFDYIKREKHDMFQWLTFKSSIDESKAELIRLAKLLMVLNKHEIKHPGLIEPDKLLSVVEEIYHFWRNMGRYSIMYALNDEGYQIQNFIDADTQFNALVLNLYRTIQQKIQDSKNKIFRQLQAGTNASILLQKTDWDFPSGYEALKGIPFITEMMLRTPLILHPKSNKRIGMFEETYTHPMKDFIKKSNEWICFPCKVGDLLTFAYFHIDYIGNIVACPNLFEIASRNECLNRKPDCMVLFGNPDGKNETTFYHDKKEDIWIGKISSADVIEYFGYVKKMFLTLHNLAVMERGWLPIHGAMVKLYLRDGREKHVMFMGDSGAGKSETIEALSSISEGLIDRQEVIFDDMGTIHIDRRGNLVAQGTEIGAFVRLDDLEMGSAYRDMDRSVFFNPELSNARVVVPTAPYKVITNNHPIDCFMYANNYTDKRGMHKFDSLEEAKSVFVEGKRNALGTTQEIGLSTTFFANPFGPMQKQEVANPLIDKMFEKLFEKNIYVGEIYSCLGLPNKGDNGIQDAARALLDFVLK